MLIRLSKRVVRQAAYGALFLIAGTAAASEMSGEGLPAGGKSAYRFLSAQDIETLGRLPEPPAAGSVRAEIERSELQMLARTRSADRLALAQHDADVENVTAFASIIGKRFDLATLPATARLFGDLRSEESKLVKSLKARFKRPRPWEGATWIASDPALEHCDKGASRSSYPSGHALMGYTAGAMLAHLLPEKAPAFVERSQEYAESRLACLAHFRSDIEASQVLAAGLVVTLLQNPEFKAEVEAARAELLKAHVL